MLNFLAACVKGRLNCLISGGTGAGKTTLLNVLSSFISEHERIVTIEDAAELQLRQEHVARLETRPANVEGKGAVKQRQLVVNALRMRPDRIVIGEVRSEEALDMLQAMNTGHDGSLTTVHANTPRDALTRIETMIAMGATNLPERAMRQQISSAINIVVQQTRLSDGSRRVTDHLGNHRDGRRHHHDAGRLRLREDRPDARRQGDRALPRDRRPAEVLGTAEGRGHQPAAGDVLRLRGGALMLLAIGVFLIVTGIAMGVGWVISAIPGNLAQKRLEKRLREVGSISSTTTGETASVVRQDEAGPLPAFRSCSARPAPASACRA